jgi:DNA-directed RNA polymerase subunit beta'
MANLNPVGAFTDLKERVKAAISKQFPYEGQKHRIELIDIEVKDDSQSISSPFHIDNIQSQYEAKTQGGTWAVPIRATLRLVDKESGKTLDQTKITLARLPKITRRYSYIIEGNEKQHDSIFRLKARPYHIIADNGQIRAYWNLAKGHGFDLNINPTNGLMDMKLGSSHIPIYQILKTLGVKDSELEQAWGKEVLEVNRKKSKPEDLIKIHKVLVGREQKGYKPPPLAEVETFVKTTFDATRIREEAMVAAFGKPYDRVNGENLLLSTRRILDIARGQGEEDDRQSLSAKDIAGTEDFVIEALERRTGDIRRKVLNNIDRKTTISGILAPNSYSKVISGVFSHAQLPEQTNPLQFVSGYLRTTLRGAEFGGVKGEHSALDRDKLINPSHLGFLDPIHSPEGPDTGIALHLPLGVRKDGKELKIDVYDVRQKKFVEATPGLLERAVVAYPDQVQWKDRHPIPVASEVVVYDADRNTTKRPWKDVDYVLRSAKGLFSFSANLIPFLQNNNGNRAMMAAKQQEQAVALVHREVPLIQTKSESAKTFEQILGSFNAHLSPIAGHVTSIELDQISIRGDNGKVARVPIYNHYPLNGGKNMLHAQPTIRVGDRVQAKDVIADTTYTKNGTLALGTNMRVAYIPFHGLNYEDSIIVSESAAQKLTSHHLYAEYVDVLPGMLVNKKRWTDYALPERATAERLAKLGDDGVIKEGQQVAHGDVLVARLGPTPKTKETDILAGIHRKSLVRDFRDNALIWDHDHQGKVIKVIHSGRRITVHVETMEPAVIGDKMAGRHGNKGIIGRIFPDHEMPYDKDGKPVHVLLSPSVVPSRMNVGQVLETAGSKIARKTGKPYIVENFLSGVDYTQKVKDDLKANGLTDTEELFDAKTKKSLGPVLVGDQYMLKLHHMVDKKISARSHGGAYTSKGQAPAGSGIPGGGQKMDMLTTYAMLAHGATANLREAQTYKCFLGNTKIITDHGLKRIAEIVNKKLDVKVASLTEDGTVEMRPILKYWKRPLNMERMVRVESMAVAQGGRFMRWVTKCTEGHEFYTSRGKVRAGDLIPGVDTLYTRASMPSPAQMSVLVGSLFGDGHLSKRHHNFPAFQERHCARQKEYLEWKATVLAEFSRRAVREYIASEVGFNAAGQEMVEWTTLAQPAFLDLHRIFYGSGEKRFPPEAFHRLDILALAVWFLDDGSAVMGGRQRLVRLHTNAMTHDEKSLAIHRILQLTGVTFRLNSDGKSLACSRQGDTEKFLRAVAPYVHPSMAYKLLGFESNEKLWADIQRAECFNNKVIETPVIRVRDLPHEEIDFNNEGSTLYNLEVEGNHNYFANGLLVGNSDADQDEVWLAVQTGRPLPDPKPTRGMGIFQDYLKAMGIHVEKKGDQYVLAPMTDKQTLAMSNGQIKFPDKALKAKEMRTIEEAGGLFDPKVTGGLAGKFWAHIKLQQRIPNSAFERAILTVTGMKQKEFETLVGPDGAVNGKSGFDVINERLKAIDVDKELKATEQSLGSLNGAALNKAYRKVRYLRNLQKLKITPYEAYTNAALPVIPPAVRRVSIGLDGKQVIDDLNGLYWAVGQINEQIAKADPSLPLSEHQKMRAHLYDAVRGLRISGMDMGDFSKQRHHFGLMEKLKGTVPKASFFQDGVLSRRQDLSGRSTIVPEPAMGLDEVGIPLPIALEMYKPFIVQELHKNRGFSPLQAQKIVQKKDQAAIEALHRVVADRPVLMKRDPALHKFSIMAFHPRIIGGKAIAVHPLVTGGFNADHDGDTMALYVPVSDEARDEALQKMLPSKNLFSPTHGGLMIMPGQEALLGLYQLTAWGKQAKVPEGVTPQRIIELLKAGKLNATDVITYKRKETTVGRVALHEALPPQMKDEQKLLYDKTFRLDKSQLKNYLSDVARKYPSEFPKLVDNWKDYGNLLSYMHGSSFSLDDFSDGKKFRDEVLVKYQKAEDAINASPISKANKDQQVVDLYAKASNELKELGTQRYNRLGNKVYDWISSGAKGNWTQFSQMVFGPMIVVDANNTPVPVPIKKSFGEGLSIAEYWASLHGARKGTLDRARGTKDPGSLTKDIINTTINYHITAEDCGTTNGVAADPNDSTADIFGRYLAQEVKLKGGDVIAAKTLLTPTIVTRIKNSGVHKIIVRSPLYCRQPIGICNHCHGLNENNKLYSLGTNVGVIAGQALGEPVTQMAMRTFHSGGVAGEVGITDYFERAKQIFFIPKILPDAAVLATVGGTVGSVQKNTALGGFDVMVSGTLHRIPARLSPLLHIQLGAVVKKGDPLSTGPINPHDMLSQTGNINAVRNYMTDELIKVYPGGTRRRNVETVIKAMTNLTRVEHDPTELYTRGQLAPMSEIEHQNRMANQTNSPIIQHSPILRPMTQVPLDGQEDWMARLNYRKLQETYEEGAAQGWSSDIHGHPIPGLAHGAEFGVRLPKGVESPAPTVETIVAPKAPKPSKILFPSLNFFRSSK